MATCVKTCFRSDLGGPDALADALAEIDRLRAALAAALREPQDKLQAGADEWQPGGLRCDNCDNGIADVMWEFCPWCGAGANWRPSPPTEEKR